MNNIFGNVILSGERTSLREVLSDSKDPMPLSRSMNLKRHFGTSSAGEFLGAPLLIMDCKGSFDCVGVRFANTNFAQDDRM